MPEEVNKEERLHSRFAVAREFSLGRLGYGSALSACKALDISLKTLRRDIARASQFQTFDEWRPKKRGPVAGQRRVVPGVMKEIESLVYSAADQKLNRRKLSRDLELLLPESGFAASDVPSQSTINRVVGDMLAADSAFFADSRHGRHGRAEHSLQKGSLETQYPLQIVCIDHTALNARTLLIEGQSIVVRPTFTAAIDLYTGCCLAAFISAFPPCAITVALTMALMSVPKTPLLRKYGLPGEDEAGGSPVTLYVDGAADLTGSHVERGCRINGIELRIGWPGRPERRGRMERFWKTCESEIHSWPSTTLGNPQELEAHGGQKPPAWSFDIMQRQVLAMVMTYNNETYGGVEIPPIMKWRAAAGTARMARMTPQDPEKTFRDFLPTKPRCKINFQGIKLFNCFYRSGDLAKLRYEGVTHVEVVYDPRDVSRIWIYHQKAYIELPRVYPQQAPRDLRALQAWWAGRRATAREKRDTKLLQKLAVVRWNPLVDLDFAELPVPTGEHDPPPRSELWSAPDVAEPDEVAVEVNVEALLSSDVIEPGANSAEVRLRPDFTIPIFKPRVR